MTPLKNKLPGILDLAPLKDEHGATLFLRGNETKRVRDEDVQHPVVKRVMDAGWLEIAKPELPTPPPAPKAAEPVIKVEAPPEELKLPAALAQAATLEQAVPSTEPTPVEPAAEPTIEPQTKPGKFNRK